MVQAVQTLKSDVLRSALAASSIPNPKQPKPLPNSNTCQPKSPAATRAARRPRLYLGSTKVGATRTCVPRSATGCAPKGRSQVGHFLYCPTTIGIYCQNRCEYTC